MQIIPKKINAKIIKQPRRSSAKGIGMQSIHAEYRNEKYHINRPASVSSPLKKSKLNSYDFFIYLSYSLIGNDFKSVKGVSRCAYAWSGKCNCHLVGP